MQLITSAQQVGKPSTLLTSNMTGSTYFDAMFFGEGCACGSVTFTPGARTFWHTHEKGQILFVTQGSGLIQSEGQEPRKLKVGDVVYIPGGEKHWHGAAPDTVMTHMAVALGGQYLMLLRKGNCR